MFLKDLLRDATPEFTVGILAAVFVSCILFALKATGLLADDDAVVLSLGAGAFRDAQVHTLFTYPFHHRTAAQLLLCVAAFVLLCGSFEKSVGTVRFLFLFLLLSTATGLCYALIDLIQSEPESANCVEGLVPITLALVAVTTMHTRMVKSFLCGVSFPTIALPWVFLVLTSIFVPHAVLPCNVVAIVIGWMYGTGWFRFVDMSEARACALEKRQPFRLLRSVGGSLYVPASPEERRKTKTLLPVITPTPGSYPVQAYAPLSSMQAAETTSNTYEGWPQMANDMYSPVASPLSSHGHGLEQQGHGHGHSCSHSHGHGHSHSHH